MCADGTSAEELKWGGDVKDRRVEFVEQVLAGKKEALQPEGTAFAPSNIALCKYWGKRNTELNLPCNSSLSISLGSKGTQTRVRLLEAPTDQIFLNGNVVPPDNSFSVRLSSFLNLFRPFFSDACFEVRTENTIPTAAGLASSASGFAALVLALNELGGWELSPRKLSMLARLGSGSASRSIFSGFVQWHAGEQSDGMDSFAEKIETNWRALRVGILQLSSAAKATGSREGMNRTVETSALYSAWPAQAKTDLDTIRRAIAECDFSLLGKTAEQNALSMHATMLSAWPPLIYLLPETLQQIQKIHHLRAEGLEVYLTIDAGPNIKLLFLEKQWSDVQSAFPEIIPINPFA